MFGKRVREILLLILVSTATFLVLGEVSLRLYLRHRTFYDVEMARYAGSLKMDELLTHRYTIEESNEAYDALKSGETLRSVVTY